jgi:hypothetical protein
MKCSARLFFMIVSIYSSTNPYLYTMWVARTQIPQAPPAMPLTQDVIAVGDYHDKFHPVTDMQRKIVDNWISTCAKKNSKIILEDVSSANNQGRFGCRGYVIDSKQGILAGLTSHCQSNEIMVENIEYRYCRVISLGPLVRNTPDAFSTSPATFIQVSDLVQEIDHAIAQVRSNMQTDPPALRGIYKAAIDKTNRSIEEFKWRQQSYLTVAAYIERNTTPQNRLFMLKRMLMFDIPLFDALALHSIITARNYQKVVIFAGGTHIINLLEALKKVGYQEIFNSSVNYYTETDLSKCAPGSIYQNNFCLKPDPLDITVLDQYW